MPSLKTDGFIPPVMWLKSFLLIKTQPGLEKEVFDLIQPFPEIREIHLIAGEFDLLAVLELPETQIDPRRNVVEVVVERIRKLNGIVDTRTIIPIESRMRDVPPSNRPTIRGFVFIQCDVPKAKEIMSKLAELPEVHGVHRLFGKTDMLVELEVEKSFVLPPPQHISNLVETKISKIPGVHDTNTTVPLESRIK